MLLTLDDISVTGKRVVVREDLNVPMHDGHIADDTRILAAVPTLRELIEDGAAVIVLSHLGRPKEGVYDQAFTLEPVAKRLSELLGKKVEFVQDWIEGVHVQPGEIVLCENVRFNEGEKANDDALAKKMAGLGDIFVMDAFATAHRAHASTHGIAKFIETSVAGPLFFEEIMAITEALDHPDRPLLAIVGGSKVSTKLSFLNSLLDRVDYLIVGGGIANTFLKAAGYNIGKSLCEDDLLDAAKSLLKKAKSTGKKMPLPVDVVVASELSEQAEATVKLIADVSDDDMILDVGPETQQIFAGLVRDSGTIIWNGPVGVFEFKQFSVGTFSLAEAIAHSRAFTIAGGGDTLAAIAKFDITEGISYVSTGGGAFLQLVEGQSLPALDILESKNGITTH